MRRMPAGHKRRRFCKTAAERPASPTLSPDASAASPGKGRRGLDAGSRPSLLSRAPQVVAHALSHLMEMGDGMKLFRRDNNNDLNTQGTAPQTLERCCLCGALTDVDVTTPIQERRHYVSGVGQLCAECCYEVYGTNDLRTLPDFG